MLSLLLYWVITSLLLIVIANIVPGITLNGFGAAMLAALVIGLINISIKRVLFVLTLPITILTLGLFSLILNALMFLLAAWLVPGFAVSGFISALIGSLIFALFTSIVHMLDLRMHPV